MFLQRLTLLLFVVQVAYAHGDQGTQCDSDQGGSVPASTGRALLQTKQGAYKTSVNENKPSVATDEKKLLSVAGSAPSTKTSGQSEKGTGDETLKRSAQLQHEEEMDHSLEGQARRDENTDADAEFDDEDDGEVDEDDSEGDEDWSLGDAIDEEGHVVNEEGDSQKGDARITEDAEEDNEGQDGDAADEDAGKEDEDSILSQEDIKLSQENHQVDDPSLVSKDTSSTACPHRRRIGRTPCGSIYETRRRRSNQGAGSWAVHRRRRSRATTTRSRDSAPVHRRRLVMHRGGTRRRAHCVDSWNRKIACPRGYK